jgi:LPXTG-site transpeptidase (sortase) family protein
MVTVVLQPNRTLPLFIGTFVSAFLLIFGLGVLGFSILPVVYGYVVATPEYHPQLPLAADRDEPFLDLSKDTSKQLYPPLTSPEHVESGNWIRIPSIDVNVPLALSPSIEDKDVIATLIHGAALYPNGILPGRLGNVFISAHSTGEPWKGTYRFAFTKINEIKPGNIINLDYNGTRYTYRVVRSDLVKPDPNFQVVSDRPVPTVTLMACWPLWTTNQRMLVKGELTNITKLTPKPF